MASSSKNKGSLSSVVSELVRAQHGAAADSVPADDLDAYVADMLLKEAREREARWGKEGVAVYFSDEDEQAGPKHRTNKRFLNNMIKNVDDHNQLLAKQDKERERKELPSNPRGTGNRLFALAKSGMGSKESKRPKREEIDIKGKGRANDEDEGRRSSTRDVEKRSRRSASPERSSRRKRYSDDEEEYRSSRRKRDSDADELRSRRKHYSDEEEAERSHRRKSERKDHSGTERESRRSKHRDEDKRESRSKRHEYSDEEAKPRRSRKHEYSDEERDSRRRRRDETEEERDSRRSKKRRSRHSSDEEKPRKHSDRLKERERSPSRTLSPALPVPRVLPPSRSPSPPPQDDSFKPSHLPSKMDKYFSSTYDPRLDVSVSDLTDTNGFIGEGNFDEWSRMIEILKVRKEEKGFREREREEQKLIEREKKREKKKKGVEIKDDYAAATGKALLSIGGYAKSKKTTEWGSGPDLSF